MPDSKSDITVFYNSACPVCDAGIGHQKERMAGCAVQWKDVHTDTAARSDIDAPLECVRERLHALDGQGRVQVGVDAAILIWRNSPRENWKARLISLPVVYPLARVAYNILARLLYRWNLRKGHWQPPV